jgi:hypothetical protein
MARHGTVGLFYENQDQGSLFLADAAFIIKPRESSAVQKRKIRRVNGLKGGNEHKLATIEPL